MDAICNEKVFRLGQLAIYLRQVNMQMTMVAKMKLIYPSTITIMGQTIMCISSPRTKWVGNRSQRRNRKCTFGNDLLQGTQSNVDFSAAALTVGFFGHSCPFFHIVYLPCTSQGFVKSLCSFLCLVKF